MRPARAGTPGRGVDAMPLQGLPDRRGCDGDAEPGQLAAIRRYPQCSLPAAMRSTRRTMWRWVGGRPGLFGFDLAAQRRRTISRCQRRIVPGVMNECSAPWREREMSVSSAANSARSVHVSLGRAAVCRCRTASWWRSRRISASFHAGGRLDSRSHAGIWTARRNTKRRHTRRDHRPPGCRTASRQHPDDLPVRGFRQPQVGSPACQVHDVAFVQSLGQPLYERKPEVASGACNHGYGHAGPALDVRATELPDWYVRGVTPDKGPARPERRECALVSSG